jgi:ABC-2 type transport system ATP-binding protein
MPAALETDHLSRNYGKTEAVKELTLSVAEGSVFAFVGPNGAGKTTTIKTVMNLLEPTAGRAAVLGTDSRKLGPVELRQIGYVSENQELPLWMTVRQFASYAKAFYPSWDHAFATSLARQFDLPPDRPLKALSRGMRMKAALLCSLAYRPRLLIMDEPFAGLDALVRDELIQGVLELTQQERWTVFVSSHDIDEVERLADWIGIINEGRLYLSEPVSSVLARFRQVEVTVDDDASLPSPLPSSWLLAEASAHVVRFVDSAFDDQTEGRVRIVWPRAKSVSATPLSLRNVFVTLARGWRLSSPAKEAL